MQDTDPKSNWRLSPETLAAQAMGEVEPLTRALVPPVHMSTTFERDADGGYSSGRAYSRPHNPSYDAPQRLLARLEGGHEALLLSSGMAAATTVFQALLPGDHVVAPRIMYWALRKWLTDFAMPWGLDVEFVDTTDLDVLAAAMRPGQTRMVWIETPANPTWDVTDIQGAADIAHAVRARLAVDATVATPVLTRPIEMGADIVVHSATKYLNGHSDVLAGAIVCAREDAYWNRVRAWRRDGGAMLGSFEAWLLLRGMRTLFVRVERASRSALALARHFHAHPLLSHVLYPGLEDHPHHALATRQMSGGFGGMLSVRHAHGEQGAMATAAAMRVFKRATSLGGVESLVEHRASIEGPTTPVPADLLRLSIGMEDVADLIADLEQALEQSVPDASSAAPRRCVAGPEPAVAAGDLESRVARLLDTRLKPLVGERGGELHLLRVVDGVVELRYAGSPGACMAIEKDINNLLCHYLPELSGVRLRATDAPVAEAGEPASLGERVQQVLDEQVNPAVAAHQGHITLLQIGDATVHLGMEGGCQGCAMADVTLRQGIEPILRRAIPQLVAVVDDTDHAAGCRPFFKTRKS